LKTTLYRLWEDTAMTNILRSEFFRTSKIKSVYIAPILITALLLITSLVFDVFAAQFEGAQIPAEVLDISGKGLVYQALSNSMTTTFLAIIVSILVAGSFSNGAVRTYVSRGANRFSLYFSKLITVFTLSVALCLFSFFIAWIWVLILGYGNIAAADIPPLIASMGMQLLVILGFVSLYTFFSFLLRSTGGSIGLSIGLFIFVSIAQGLILMLSAMGNNLWMQDLLQIFLSTQLSTAATAGGQLETWQYLCVTLVPLACIAVTTGLGLLSFKLRDIK